MSDQILPSVISVLDQGKCLLLTLDDTTYGAVHGVASGSIGAHYRHSLDHFDNLLEGMSGGFVDYDARRRDLLTETVREVALQKTEDLQKMARALDPTNFQHPIIIRCAVANDQNKSPEVTSTIEREIMFCISHAIHHYALITVICRELKVQLPDGFGVAPSTLRYRGTPDDASVCTGTLDPF